MSTFTIPTPRGPRQIGDGQPCFIVAEMSCNHNQNLDTARQIVRLAAESGADAIKLQTYTPDTITIDSHQPWFVVAGKDNPDSWQGQTFYELYQKAYTPWDWHNELKELAESLGLVFFSSPFDASAVDFLESLKVPMYKIASYECTDQILLKKVGATGKPVIISVGFATAEEIVESLTTLREAGSKDIVLLQCATSYSDLPDITSVNLRTMADMRNRFDVMVGFSDNNAGIEIPLQATMLGAAVVEKHLMLDDDTTSLDARFSLGSAEFANMVKAIRRAESALGKVNYGPITAAETYNLRFRRSLFVVKHVKAGEIFTADNVRSIRPADGLPTKHYEAVLGRQAARDIERGTPLQWELVI